MDYDPLHNRENSNLTFYDAVVVMIKCIFGTGIFAVPFGFYRVGYIGGLILTFVTIFALTCAIHILFRAMNETCRRYQVPYLTFDQAMEKGFLEGPPAIHPYGPLFKLLIKLFFLISYFCSGTFYTVFIARLINRMLAIHYHKIDDRIIILALIIPLTIIFLIRHLKDMIIYCLIANILLFTGYFIMIYFAVQNLPPLSKRRQFNALEGIPDFVEYILYSSTSLGVFLSVESKMIEPWRYISYFGVLNVSMFITCVVLSGFGFLGYWKFGDKLRRGKTQIYTPRGHILSQCVNIFLAISIYMTFTLQCSVIMDVLWVNGISSRYPPEKQFTYEVILRFLVVVLICVSVILLHDFRWVVFLSDTVTSAMLNFVFPIILDMCVRYKSGFGPLKIYFFRDMILIIFGLMIVVLSFWACFKPFNDHFENEN